MKATAAMAAQSYSKAVNGSSCVNDAKVISQFAERGIDATPALTFLLITFGGIKKGGRSAKARKACES